MAGQQETHLLCKLKDWSLYLKNPNKSCVNMIVHLEFRHAESIKGTPQSQLASSDSKFWLSQDTMLLSIRETSIEEDT